MGQVVPGCQGLHRPCWGHCVGKWLWSSPGCSPGVGLCFPSLTTPGHGSAVPCTLSREGFGGTAGCRGTRCCWRRRSCPRAAGGAPLPSPRPPSVPAAPLGCPSPLQRRLTAQPSRMRPLLPGAGLSSRERRLQKEPYGAGLQRGGSQMGSLKSARLSPGLTGALGPPRLRVSRVGGRRGQPRRVLEPMPCGCPVPPPCRAAPGAPLGRWVLPGAALPSCPLWL